jgi:hypothetical protein
LKTPKLQNNKTKNVQNSQEQSTPPPCSSHQKKKMRTPKMIRTKLKTLKLEKKQKIPQSSQNEIQRPHAP